MGNSNKRIMYFTSANNTIDIALVNQVNTSYPVHTHAEHYVMGIVMEGEIIIETDADNMF